MLKKYKEKNITINILCEDLGINDDKDLQKLVNDYLMTDSINDDVKRLYDYSFRIMIRIMIALGYENNVSDTDLSCLFEKVR